MNTLSTRSWWRWHRMTTFGQHSRKSACNHHDNSIGAKRHPFVDLGDRAFRSLLSSPWFAAGFNNTIDSGIGHSELSKPQHCVEKQDRRVKENRGLNIESILVYQYAVTSAWESHR